MGNFNTDSYRPMVKLVVIARFGLAGRQHLTIDQMGKALTIAIMEIIPDLDKAFEMLYNAPALEDSDAAVKFLEDNPEMLPLSFVTKTLEMFELPEVGGAELVELLVPTARMIAFVYNKPLQTVHADILHESDVFSDLYSQQKSEKMLEALHDLDRMTPPTETRH